jgi:hypothetical protein
MFTDLLDQPRRELEALRAQCASQEARISKLESMLVKCATQKALRTQCAEQEARIAKLESMMLKCAADRPLSIAALSSMGFTVSDFKANGYPLINIIRSARCPLSVTYLASIGYTIQEMKNSYSFKAKDFKDAGFKLQDININAGGYHNKSLKEFKDAGFTLKEFKDAGYKFQEIKDEWPYLTEAAFNLI